jgi:drug/metabolite transporter (DMT)-like permease
MLDSGVFNLIFFSFLTGLSSYFVKIIHGLTSQQILFYRAILASIFLLGTAFFTRRMKELKFRFPIGTITMSLAEGLSIYFYYLALEKTTIANAMLLVYTAPIFSVILSSVFLHEKIERKTILAIIISFIGVFIVSNPSEIRINPQQLYGSFFALLGGFFYSAMAISSKLLTHKTTPLYTAFWQYFLITFFSFVFALPIQMVLIKNNIFPLIYLGWAAGGLAFLLYMRGIKKVKGQIIQIITMFEIFIGILSGVILLNEKLSLHTVIGGILILLSIFIVS